MSSPAPRDIERRAGLASVAGFALLAVYFTGFFPPFTNPNELSRFQTVYAVVENRTFRIDEAMRVLGEREDKAFSGGHFYSNKAPGLAFAAIPIYGALRTVFPAPKGPSDVLFVLVRMLTVSLVCAVAMARFVSRVRPVRGSALLVLGVVFGTPLLYYGRSFFSHAWTAALLFLSWDLVRRREERPEGRGGALLAAAAGLLAGWAAISEYTAAPLALLLFLRMASRRAWKQAAVFTAGAAAAILLLAGYNAICFGSPWLLSSAREADTSYAELASHGLFGLGAPSLRVAWDYLFHPARGAFLFSPFWLWAIPGFLRWWRSGEDRADCLFCLVSVAGFFVLMTGYPNWHGGWALGNRYLLPVLFFAGLAVARGLASPLSRGLFAAAVLFSAANGLLMTASWPHFWPDLSWPAANGSLWFLGRGWVAPNLLSLSGPGWASLLLPAAALCGAAFLALRAARPAAPPPAVSTAAALALFAVSLVAAPVPSYDARLLRAGVYGTFSGLDPERTELKREMAAAATPAEQRRAVQFWRIYGTR